MYLNGEARFGKGREIAHLDLLIGDKEGPVGQAFANSLASQMEKHPPLFAIIAPNLVAKPITLMVPKVSIKGMLDVMRVYGPAQKAIASAVVDCVYNEIIPEDDVEDICIICSFFIHPEAKNSDEIYKNNYEAAKSAIKRAFVREPSIDEILNEKDSVVHPFYEGPH
ncbi:formaldehyde-activating enzyme [Methanobacterium sp. ACI-7]|uniref:formaldehyde-activating enzyme n=1 Tax=unclassified Methanobacterium TaxID=2627676 RepID=UPI0039C37F12